MNRNRIVNRSSSELMSSQLLHSSDSMVITNITFIWDRERSQLIIFAETKFRVGSGVYALIKGDNLILETHMESSYNKPVRFHLLKKENRDEFEEGLIDTRFSEIKLNSGYKYSVLSSCVLETNLVKVVLEFRPGNTGTNQND